MQFQSLFPKTKNSEKQNKIHSQQQINSKNSIIEKKQLKGQSRAASLEKQSKVIKQKQIFQARRQKVNLFNEKDGMLAQIKKQIAEILEVAYHNQIGKGTTLSVSMHQNDDNNNNKHKDQDKLIENISSKKKSVTFNNKSQFRNNSNQKIRRFKKIKTENPSLSGNQSFSLKYNLNESKLEKIQNNKFEVFKTRPKLSTTPFLIPDQKELQRSKIIKNVNQTMKKNKNKVKFILSQKKQELELPKLNRKSRVVYTQASKTIDAIGNKKNIEVLQRLISKQLCSDYQSVSLKNSNVKEGGCSSTKIIRLHRMNFLKP